MFQLPQILWQHSYCDGRSARFSLDAPATQEEKPVTFFDDALESLRCDIIVELSNRLTEASIAHPRLAPFLMDALDNALEKVQLLEHEELQPIQQWLGQEIGKQINRKKQLGKTSK